MCEHHHIQTNASIKQYDPTRTTTLRNAFAADMERRFKELLSVIKKTVVERDAFGLTVNQMTPPLPGAFDFPLSTDKVEAFMEWLQVQIDAGILEVSPMQTGNVSRYAWTNKYILDSYKRGLIRARIELKKAGYDVPPMDIDGLMGTPFHLDRVGLLFIRAYNELQGVTDDMAKQISKILAQGMIDGDGPAMIARKLKAVVDGVSAADLGITDSLGRFIPAKRRAEMIARTETIRAHHQATINEYQSWGAQGVSVLSEFRTAGDNRVCSICSSLEGETFDLETAMYIIPVHPMCFIDPQIPIYTSEGWKPIGNIKVGDMVLTHKHRFRKVTALIRNEKQKADVVKFKFKGKLHLSMTANHPVRVQENGVIKWKDAGECTMDDKVMVLANEHLGEYGSVPLEIESINKWKLKKPRTLYNFSVEEDESYIAKGVVVHNCRCICLPIKMN